MNNTAYPQEVFTWMITSMQTVPLFYGTMPAKELYKVFQSGKDEFPGRDGAPGVGDISENDYVEMLRGFLSIANRPDVAGTPGLTAAGVTCRFDGDEIVPIGSEELVKAIRAEKKKMPFQLTDYRILSYPEVMQVVTKGYVETPETAAFENYLKNRWKKSENEAVELVRHFSIGFRTGEDLPQESFNELGHILELNKQENAITQDEFTEMFNIFVDVYHVTGQMTRNGWAPTELHEKMYGQKAPEVKSTFNSDSNASPLAGLGLENLKPGSRLAPASSYMAGILKEHEEELKKMGITVDYEAATGRYSDKHVTPEGTIQRGRAKKVYRNDPCPCGSGLKYKNCHGKA